MVDSRTLLWPIEKNVCNLSLSTLSSLFLSPSFSSTSESPSEGVASSYEVKVSSKILREYTLTFTSYTSSYTTETWNNYCLSFTCIHIKINSPHQWAKHPGIHSVCFFFFFSLCLRLWICEWVSIRLQNCSKEFSNLQTIHMIVFI